MYSEKFCPSGLFPGNHRDPYLDDDDDDSMDDDDDNGGDSMFHFGRNGFSYGSRSQGGKKSRCNDENL